MVGQRLVDVVGVVQRIVDQFGDVVVGQLVVDEVAVATRGDDAGQPQLGEVLGDSGRRLSHARCQLVDAQLALAQMPDDVQPGAVGEHPERLHGQLDLPVVWHLGRTTAGRRLRICAISERVVRLSEVSDRSIIRVGGWPRLSGDGIAALGSGAGFTVGLTLDLSPVPVPAAQLAFLAGMLIGGRGPALDGLRALRRGRLDVDLLMVGAAAAAAALGQWRDASLLIVIFATTGALETAATTRTAAGVRALIVDAPEQAERLVGSVDGATETLPADSLAVGDRILVRPGARVPADGTVVDGEAAVDESSLTGEALPVRKVAGRDVLAGSAVVEGFLVVGVTAETGDTVLARLAAAVDQAVQDEPPTQLAIERFEQRYAIGVVVGAVAIALAGPLWWTWTGTETVNRTMTFLVVASPCAVVLATMPATLSALAAAARHRVLIRGGSVLERLADLDVAAFDKTGTLTVGTPEVTLIVALDDQREADILAAAAAAERWSEHPIGRAIVAEAAGRSLDLPVAIDVEVLAARGVRATVAGRTVRVGGPALLGELPQHDDGATTVGVDIDGDLAGLIVLHDRLRGEAACTVACLARVGVTDTWLLTGDHAVNAATVARTTGITSTGHGLLPDEKARRVRELRADGRRVAYIGDGVNDAAALTVASVGVSLGQRGTALAVDAADAVIIDDDLHRLPDVIDLARRTRRVVRANLVFAMTVIAALVALDLAGRLPLILGVIGHEGSSVLVALNGLRLLRWRPPGHLGAPDTPDDPQVTVTPTGRVAA